MHLGTYRQSIGGVAAGADNNKLWRVLTAGENPMLITAAQFYGGDASEYYTIVQVPPGAGNLDGTEVMSDLPGAIVVQAGNIEGGAWTEDSPQSLLNSFQRQTTQGWILPAFYTLAVMPVTAASTAAFVVTMGGFEYASPTR
jgi:hypothetical protein